MGNGWKSPACCVKLPRVTQWTGLKLQQKLQRIVAIESTRRSFACLICNPVVLGIRIAVYSAMVSSFTVAYCNFRCAYSLKLCHVSKLVNDGRDHFFLKGQFSYLWYLQNPQPPLIIYPLGSTSSALLAYSSPERSSYASYLPCTDSSNAPSGRDSSARSR